MNTSLPRPIAVLLACGLLLDSTTSPAFAYQPTSTLFVTSHPVDFECQAVVPWLWRFLTPDGPKKTAARLDRVVSYDVQWGFPNPYDSVGAVSPYQVNMSGDQYEIRWEAPS